LKRRKNKILCLYLPYTLIIVGFILAVIANYICITGLEKVMTNQLPENYMSEFPSELLKTGIIVFCIFYNVALFFILDKLDEKCNAKNTKGVKG